MIDCPFTFCLWRDICLLCVFERLSFFAQKDHGNQSHLFVFGFTYFSQHPMPRNSQIENREESWGSHYPYSESRRACGPGARRPVHWAVHPLALRSSGECMCTRLTPNLHYFDDLLERYFLMLLTGNGYECFVFQVSSSIREESQNNGGV